MRGKTFEENLLVLVGRIGMAAIECGRKRRKRLRRSFLRDIGRECFTHDSGRRLTFPARVQLEIALKGFRDEDGRPFHMYMIAYVIH